MANEKLLALMKSNGEDWKEWNEWRYSHEEVEIDLSHADLTGVDLSMIELRYANLTGANLTRANLMWANLSDATLQGANLTETNLQVTKLLSTTMTDTTVTNADFDGATFGWTIFGNVDLRSAKGLETIRHEAPSYIDIQTIYRSGGNIPEAFLRGAGVPDNFITFMKSLTGQAFDFYSCFISHSSKDREFVKRLYADLQSNGVRCWYAPHHMEIGAPILNEIDKAIRVHDKLLLILSENSVSSRWVEHEVLSATTKEYQQERDVRTLFPIRLDDAVMDTSVQWARNLKDTRHIVDFTGWKSHDNYKKAFDRLLRDLKGKS